jgi:hypothetical protein
MENKYTCKLNIDQELSSGMKSNKTDVIPADAYFPGIHKVKEVIGKLTFDTRMLRNGSRFSDQGSKIKSIGRAATNTSTNI